MDFIKTSAAAVIVCTITLSSVSMAGSENLNRAFAREEARSNALQTLGKNVEVRWGDHGHIVSVFARNGLQLPPPQSASTRPELVTAALRDVLGFEGGESLVNAQMRNLQDGVRYLRLQQEIAGIPVAGSKLSIRYDRYGKATSVSSNIIIDKGLPRIPELTPDAAIAVVFETANDGFESAIVDTRLVYFSKSTIENHLAWEVIDRHKGISRQHFVDAVSGEYLQGVTLTSHAKYRRVYSANQVNDVDAQLLFVEGGTSSDSHANEAYKWAGQFYDHLYSDFEQRDSYDDAGSNIKLSVHYRECVYPDVPDDPEPKPCTFPYWNNAKYDPVGHWFVFGDGDGTNYSAFGEDPDWVSHEIAHGITFDEALGPFTDDEGGAINEALSDIFAASFHYDRNNDTLSSASWKLGEQAYLAGDAIRYLNDPVSNGTGKDNYMEFEGQTAESLAPHHDNSGIISLAFYLLSQGGTHPRGDTSTYVPGIGFNNARELLYEGMIGCLEQNETMESLRDCLVERAHISDAENNTNFENAVNKAFDAVCVPPACQPLQPPASISTSSWDCWGYHSVSWSSVAGTDIYQLWLSDTTNFENAQPLYTGTSTSKIVDIPHSGYVGIRACNGLGCTAFTKSGHLQRLGVCM